MNYLLKKEIKFNIWQKFQILVRIFKLSNFVKTWKSRMKIRESARFNFKPLSEWFLGGYYQLKLSLVLPRVYHGFNHGLLTRNDLNTTLQIVIHCPISSYLLRIYSSYIVTHIFQDFPILMKWLKKGWNI